uniref:hypothetical protein n=1 Tax=Streptomyces sp. PTD5-9 TaxID=3120150 RepID=UPI00300B33CE
MRLRTLICATGTTAAAAAMAVLSTGTAHAYSEGSITSNTSAKGGWGAASTLLSTDGFSLRACDYGPPDGYRAVAHLIRGSYHVTSHAASGSGKCNVEYGWLPQPPDGTYTLKVCLRDGAGGSDFACRSTSVHHDGSM